MKIIISDLNKADVLLALYNHAGPGAPDCNKPGSQEAAQKCIEKTKVSSFIHENVTYKGLCFEYPDLGAGPRPLKIYFLGDDFDPVIYDHFHGAGQALKAINTLRRPQVDAIEFKDNPKNLPIYKLKLADEKPKQILTAIENKEKQKASPQL